MKNKSLTLTIVIPAYNEEDYLAACLDSINSQTLIPDEVIVVDNNSSDKTVQIAKQYSFVKLIKEERQGVFWAAQTGFKAASSDIIGRIDADTILSGDWVERVLDSLAEKQIAAVTGPVSYYDMPLPHSNYWFDHLMRKLTYDWAPKSPFLYGSNLAIRRGAWQQISSGLCHESNIHEDIDLAIHLKINGGQILYKKDLLSAASGRRYNDGIRAFGAYLGMYPRTYHKHGLYSLAIYPAIFMWSLGYVIMHPWRNAWYSLYAKVNSCHPLTAKVRKNPMSG
jgi:glycosyltransferase involved in cell wall biosynthesis